MGYNSQNDNLAVTFEDRYGVLKALRGSTHTLSGYSIDRGTGLAVCFAAAVRVCP